jgi:hypothetical protein
LQGLVAQSFFYPRHNMTIPSQHHDVNALEPELNRRPPTLQGSILIPSYPPLAKPQALQSRMHIMF